MGEEEKKEVKRGKMKTFGKRGEMQKKEGKGDKRGKT